MKIEIKTVLVTMLLALGVGPLGATTWMIGDNDGFGIGIPDDANHTFVNPVKDYRSAAEIAATNGAQYTDTYSVTHGTFSPADQTGDLATFIFTGLGNSWTEGSMWFDMADFQASTFGSVITTYNGINQNWAFNDGYPSTKVRFFDLQQDVIDSINATGQLVIGIDRNGSGDFYGFDYAMLSDRVAANTSVPDSGSSIALFGLGLLGIAGIRRKLK